jgi:Baseplate J-like protein
VSFDPIVPGTGLPGQDLEVYDPNVALAADESGYNAPDVETDQDAIAEAVFTALAARAPGWQAHDGNLDTWLIEAWAEVGAEIRSLAADVPASIFMTYGQNVLGIPPHLATPANGVATFTAADDLGYTLDIGTTFALARSGNDLVAFETLDEATIEAGSTSIDVEFAGVETGAAANGLSGDGQLLDPVAFVVSVTVTAPTVGGNDEETAEDYLDRITLLLQMVALRPFLPQDFAILALQVEGVGRAVAMNLYDPVANTWTNERTVTLVLTDADGEPCTPEVKQAVADQLEALREVNWVLHVIDATYNAVAVAFEVVAFAGQDQTQVQQACIDNVTAALQPANYRLGEMSPGIGGGEVINPPVSGQPVRRRSIHVNDLVAILDRSLGVDWVVSVKINGTAADYQLPSPYALPTPGAITGTVDGASP